VACLKFSDLVKCLFRTIRFEGWGLWFGLFHVRCEIIFHACFCLYTSPAAAAAAAAAAATAAVAEGVEAAVAIFR
jgi:hypothetical protein